MTIQRWLTENIIRQWIKGGMSVEEAKALWRDIDSMNIVERKDRPPYAGTESDTQS